MLLPAAIFSLSQQCAPFIDSHTMATLVTSESSGNPYAIGVVGMQLDKQPTSVADAIATAKSLIEKGANISVGLGQINQSNFSHYGLTVETAFDQCTNLNVSGQILSECYNRSATEMGEGQDALKAALSCYYSNNFTRGFITEATDKPSYVMKMAINSSKLKHVPQIEFTPNEVKEVSTTQVKKSERVRSTESIESLGQDNSAEISEAANVSWDVLKDFKTN